MMNMLKNISNDEIRYYAVASRGRNPDNPSDRNPGIHLEQRLEINWSGFANNITSVSKDCYILEIRGD